MATVKPLRNVSKEQADKAFENYNKAVSNQAELTAKMEKEITKVRAKYTGKLDECKTQIAENENVLKVFATENPKLFGEKKSYETAHGVLGYKLTPFKFVLLQGFEEKDVAATIAKKLPAFAKTEIKIDKQALIGMRNDRLSKQFEKLGFKITQEETFYIKAN